MNEEIIKILENSTNIKRNQIEATLKLLSEGSTIPFIARYRKEATNNLNEEQIKLINDEYKRNINLLERKESVIALIDEKGMLTEELKTQIMGCTKLAEVEDLYRPYKEKKKTKASEAIKMGLEPLAKKIMSFPKTGTIETLASGYNMEINKAIENASYIISEWISDNASYRKWIRNYMYNKSTIKTKVKKNNPDEEKTYEMYYDFSEQIKYIKHYRMLAINRAEKEKVITVSLDFEEEALNEYLETKIIKDSSSFVVPIVKDAIKDSLKRLIIPSVEREIRSEITEKCEEKAIKTFGKNLSSLLLTRPIKGTVVLGFDPAYRTGCKLAVIDEQGNLLEVKTIYPHEPKNDKIGSAKTLKELIDKYNIKLIAIGNGTASRESETFVAECIKGLEVKYIIVSEAGASIYSASKLAIEEFPDLTVEKRSAISIGRRVQDPLSELVKIDAKSIGVGEYQYDVNQKNLEEELDYSVMSIVNKVGININTASRSILKYISGMNKKAIDGIMEYKKKHNFANRESLKNIKGITEKIYEQAIGFLRVPNSENPLDNTGIHPENYEDTKTILKHLTLDVKNIQTSEFKKVLEDASPEKISKETGINIYTTESIIKELKSPGLDPRDELEMPILKSDILKIEDLNIGMSIEGTVRNVASFGAFVDIGLKNDALIHISKLSKNFIKDPNEIVNVGDIIKCYVDKIDIEKKQVGLSLIKN
ncbi:MAG: RNA-binding transcriptional accessory protein [Bacilli bacterium]|nr:RNA-binding transcriptional accessory protein [Bacilli bacterium]